MSEGPYRLRVTVPARRGLDRLPAGPATAVAEFLVGDLVSAPRRVGRALRGESSGAWAARRGPYRVVYDIDEEAGEVVVLRIDHRADVCRPR